MQLTEMSSWLQAKGLTSFPGPLAWLNGQISVLGELMSGQVRGS